MADKTQPAMDDQTDDFSAELPLPLEEAEPKKPSPQKESGEPADATLHIVRKKISDAYTSEPDVLAEEDEALNEPSGELSKHQQFLKELAESGKPLPEVQQAWHEYYAALPEEEKMAVWTEFEDRLRMSASTKRSGEHAAKFRPATSKTKRHKSHRAIGEAMRQAHQTVAHARQFTPQKGLRSLSFGIGIGTISVIIFLFSFFNERFIAPLIQPGRNPINASIITTGIASANPELIVPKINLEVPVVYGVNTVSTEAVQKALQNGVVHYADTALPGEDGNLVIVGHSSNNILNPGKYKFAFVLLHQLQSGDTFYLDYHGKQYVYQVYKRLIVSPTDTSVIGPQDQTATASLITCDPPGTSTNRLVVIGRQISPSVANNTARTTTNAQATSAPILPGNSPSLWSRLFNWLSH